MNNSLQSALNYASEGFQVFPLVPLEKRPKTSNGFKSATTDSHRIWNWWEESSSAGVAIRTGRLSGGPSFFVLDIDTGTDKDGFEALERLERDHEKLPDTLSVSTPSGGSHRYFMIPQSREVSNSASGIGEGLDIRGEGGYVVAPPTQLPNGKYTASGSFDPSHIADCPEWLLDLVEKPDHSLRSSSGERSLQVKDFEPDEGMQDALLKKATQRVENGKGRNCTGFWLSCQLRDNRFPKRDAAGVLKEYTRLVAQAKDHKYHIYEAMKSLKSAYKEDPRDPWDSHHTEDESQQRKKYRHTDVGNAERLIDRHAHDIRYCPKWGKWLVWNGSRWRVDETGHINRKAKETVRSMYAEANHLADSAMRKELAKHALKSESKHRLKSMVELAKTIDERVIVSHKDLDADPMLFNVENGTVDLETGKLLPHTREHLITKQANVTYDPDAKAVTWSTFLSQIMDRDQRMIDFLKRAAGYSMTGEASEQYLFFMFGTGANGKSTFVETLGGIFEDYFQKAPTEMLLNKRPGSVPNDIARLKGARYVVTNEVEEGRRLNESQVKDLTGGDRIVARFMRGEFFEFDPTHKLWMYGNHKPEIRGTDDGIWRRILTIPFEVKIPKEERDPHLKQKLLEERSGILNWLIEGVLEWRCSGLRPPAKVQSATDEYRTESDTVEGFLKECCTTEKGAEIGSKEMHDAYEEWCIECGEDPEKIGSFVKRMRKKSDEYGFSRKRKSSGQFWIGIGLRSLEEEEESKPDPLWATDRPPVPRGSGMRHHTKAETR